MKWWDSPSAKFTCTSNMVLTQATFTSLTSRLCERDLSSLRALMAISTMLVEVGGKLAIHQFNKSDGCVFPCFDHNYFPVTINFHSTARPKIGAVVQERLVIEDPDQWKRIVSSIHDTSHMGLNRTTDMVSGKYYWPGLTSDVKAYVS